MARYALPDLEYDFGALEFFKAVWNLRDWDDVSARFEAARTVDLRVPEAVAKSGRARPA